MPIILGEYLFSSLLHDVVSIIRMRMDGDLIQFVVNVDSAMPNALIGDELRIRQILVNLLSNAIKYTDRGFVSFTASGKITDESTMCLTMEVMDSGKGIKQENLDKLFVDYFRVESENNNAIEGVGLGLSITNSLIKAMGGNISVESEYGKGSTFTVTLPQKISAPEKLASIENPESIRVLVYERREIYAHSIFFTVYNLGVHCVVVSSETELNEKLSSGMFSFLFVSFALYEENKELILSFKETVKTVLLSDFGEVIPDKSLNVLAMPTHAVSVANILNGTSDNFSYRDNSEPIVRFTAPDANILVVDDINTNLKVAKGLLLPYNMGIDLCKSGMEALETVKSQRYDLVFMDHRMPDMDGLETMKRIRAMEDESPYFKDLPIVALTANAVSGKRF
jgi:CheY-like chemotaxis protein